MINGKLLDQSIKYTCYNGEFDLFFTGYFNSFEFVELNQEYHWGLFLIKRLLGEVFTLTDMKNGGFKSDEEQYQEELKNGVQLYCCAHCGYDRDCATWQVNVTRKGNTIVWDWGMYTDWKLTSYSFNAQQYDEALVEYKEYLERQACQLDNTSL